MDEPEPPEVLLLLEDDAELEEDPEDPLLLEPSLLPEPEPDPVPPLDDAPDDAFWSRLSVR